MSSTTEQLNGKSYVKFVVINICLGFAVLLWKYCESLASEFLNIFCLSNKELAGRTFFTKLFIVAIYNTGIRFPHICIAHPFCA